MKGRTLRFTEYIPLCLILSLSLAIQNGCFWKKKIPEEEPTANELYQEGLELIEKRMFEEARDQFNKVKVKSTDTELELLAQIAVGDSYFEEKEYEAARAQYEEIFKLHSGGGRADYLQYRIGECFFWQIDVIDRDVTNAKEALKAFNRLFEDFPESAYLPLARLRLKKIHTFLAESEFFIGEFYVRKNALLAAINRFKKAIELYPSSGIEDKLLFHLYKTYKSLRDEDHADEYRRLLMEQFPNSEYIPQVKMIEKEGLVLDSLKQMLSAGMEPYSGPWALGNSQALCRDGEYPSSSRLQIFASLDEGETSPGESPIGLAGTYQGEDKGSCIRKILLLEDRVPQKTCADPCPEASPSDKETLRHRSFFEKIIPW